LKIAAKQLENSSKTTSFHSFLNGWQQKISGFTNFSEFCQKIDSEFFQKIFKKKIKTLIYRTLLDWKLSTLTTRHLDEWHEAAPACQWNLWPCVEPLASGDLPGSSACPKAWMSHGLSENGISKITNLMGKTMIPHRIRGYPTFR
jgi:hypothetical protein